MRRPLVLLLAIAALGAVLLLVLRTGGRRIEETIKGPIAGIGQSAREKASAKLEDGEALEKLDRLDEAARAYEEAAAADTTYALPVFRLGALALVRGDLASARPLIERAIRIDPGLSDAMFHLGFIQEEAADDAGAEASYREAARLDSTHAEARNNLGFLLLRLGRVDEAVPILEEGRRLDPESPYLAKNLGRAYARSRQWDRAVPLLEAAIPLAGRDPEVLIDLACAYRGKRDETKARDALRRYQSREPDPRKREQGEARFEAASGG